MRPFCTTQKKTVDKNRAKFRDIVYEMQAAPLEAVMGIISSNVPFFMATNTSLFMQVRAVCGDVDGCRCRCDACRWRVATTLFSHLLIDPNLTVDLTTNHQQEMLEELDSQPEDAVVPLADGFEVSVAQQRSALVNLFTLTMDFIEGFVNHTQGELRSHQAVLKEILEAAQNSACLRVFGVLVWVDG